jgi:hypothetical protein
MKIRNRLTGITFELDRKMTRIRRTQRRVKAWADALAGYIDRPKNYRLVMIGLTYDGVEDWRALHISQFMKRVRDELGRKLYGYAWVAELQTRDAVHYHVLLVVNRGTRIPMPDKAGWWPHGSTTIQSADSPYYIVTYTGKEHQKYSDHFPKGLRMFAVWASKKVLDGVQLWQFRLSAVPAWLREFALKQIGERVVRHKGGGWLIGEVIYESPYQLVTL